MMSHIVGQAGEMTHHLDNLLISSRSITDSVHIALEPVGLRAEADRVVSALAPGARTEVEGDDVTAVADAVRVRHVLRNLVLNAELHGGEHVRVALGSAEDRSWAEVIDDGPGVAVDEGDFVPGRFGGIGPNP